jgi:predicted dithiol-disulfide oxidoreductase (DUF899 family)
MKSAVKTHKIVSHDVWLKERTAFLKKEKQFTRLRDRLSQSRRNLPWERVEKDYVFEGPNGKETLSQLFDNRNQLIVYHFMFHPDWDAACKSCSLIADSFERNIVHLNNRDVTMVAVSRAPLTKLNAFKKRMGWTFKWVSSGSSDFNYDFYVSFTPEQLKKETYYNYKREKSSGQERPGISVFYKDKAGSVFHTYSAYERGLDMGMAIYQYLDLVPKGRDEADQKPHPMAWVRLRDSYGN